MLFLPESKIHGWNDHHIQGGGRQQTKQDDDGHGCLDLASRFAQAERNGDERQPSRQGRHQNRGKAFSRAANHGLTIVLSRLPLP